MITICTKEFSNNIAKTGALLCLDIGTVRIGMAISDQSRIIASPFAIYERRNISKDMGHLNKVATDNEVTAFVIGLPLQLNGEEGKNCIAVRKFADKLLKKTGLPILLVDERMSTAAATRALSESGMTRKKRHSLDDKTAASIILQGVLDTFKHS